VSESGKGHRPELTTTPGVNFAAKTFTRLRQVAVDKALRPSDLKIAVALTCYFKEQDQGGRGLPILSDHRP
jgi:hypothetical protein